MYTMPANFIKKHLWIARWCRHRMPFPQILQRKLLQLAKKWNSPYFSLSKFPAIRTIFSGKDSLWDNREYKWYELVEILLHQREGEGCVLVWLAEMLDSFKEVMIETSRFWHDLCLPISVFLYLWMNAQWTRSLQNDKPIDVESPIAGHSSVSTIWSEWLRDIQSSSWLYIVESILVRAEHFLVASTW